jgi:glycosyltransferase involved in cell wall biosynthesis/SAM-dependent methyltransferase
VDICTIIAKNYAAHARVLAESFLEIHPDARCSVLVIDDTEGFIDPAEERFELLGLEDIGLPDLERMATSYDVMELSTAVKPWLLRHLLARPGTDAVAYLDPDIQVFRPLDEIARRAREHGVVLTPHFTDPLPRDGRKPSEEDILVSGTYNLGFIALAPGETADSLLDWWSERLEKECLNEPERGRFVDQRWIDLAPGLWPGIDIFRDTSFNIAYWNLATRRLEDDGSGGYLVDGAPLHFFHFSGFDPRRPTELSKHQTRIRVTANPALTRICAEYADRLLAHGFEAARAWPYSWNQMPNGIELDRAARRVFRDGLETGEVTGSVFSDEGAEAFAAYLGQTANGGRVNRYVQALWETREDFRDVFPSIDGERGPEFVSWLRATADDTGVSVRLLPGDAAANGGMSSPQPPATEPGVNVVGYLSSERGVGEAARQLLASLQASAVDTAAIDTPAEPDRISESLAGIEDEEHPYDFNLICVNADMLPIVANGLGSRFFENRHSIGVWFWEISHFPELWERSLDYVDEVWVASDHIAESLRPLASIPVHTFRLPVVPGQPEEASREELGLPEGFCFLFVFDYRSVFNRKNPLGLVEAFSRAFAPGSGPSLAIKSICGDQFPEQRAALAAAAAGRPDVHLLEETVPVGMKNAMIAGCDCYVSLHRSEGFGLTLAEAMYFGKPVIGTAYSGNLDFMTAENSYPVPYEMAQIGPGADPYPPEQEWAEPDLDVAAELMREVYENPEASAAKGRRAAEDIRRTHSPAASAASMKARMEEVKRGRLITRLEHPSPAQAVIGAPRGRPKLEHLLRFPEPPPREGASNLQTSAKRLYMRLLRPYASHQQRINVGIAESLDELRQVLGEALQLDVENDQAMRALKRHMDRADELVQAAGAEPFLTGGLSSEEHPALGRTIGFRTPPGEAGAGYRGFEDLFRGSEEMIRERQRVYLDLLAGHEPVLDAGCGRGELLDLLAERGIASLGVDLDPDMVARCREKGHENVEQGDLLDLLERTPAGSLGAIFSAQVLEHLDFDQLRRFFELGLSRLKPGGLLIAETVNPHSAAALKSFWVDPTHKHPLFPEALLALCALGGYASADVFAPLGSGDWEHDRTRVGEYAVLATAPG